MVGVREELQPAIARDLRFWRGRSGWPLVEGPRGVQRGWCPMDREGAGNVLPWIRLSSSSRLGARPIRLPERRAQNTRPILRPPPPPPRVSTTTALSFSLHRQHRLSIACSHASTFIITRPSSPCS